MRILVADDGSRSAHRAFRHAAELAYDGADVSVVTLARNGASLIIDEAKQEGADFIFMGNRGLSTAGRLLLGSVSSKVVDHAPCDVLVVH